MTDSQLSLAFNFWTRVEEFGCLLVIVGIVGEGFELVVKWWRKRWFRVGFGLRFEDLNRGRISWLIRRFRPRVTEIETFSLILVGIGLLIEIAASHQAFGIADLQTATLNNEAGLARSNAASAIIVANKIGQTNGLLSLEVAQANERASRFELASAVLETENQIHDNAIEELAPRSIGDETRERMVSFLLTNLNSFTNVHISILGPWPNEDAEAGNFADDIQGALRTAAWAAFRSGSPTGLVSGLMLAHRIYEPLFGEGLTIDYPGGSSQMFHTKPPVVTILKEAFDKCNIPCTVGLGFSRSMDISIKVGKKRAKPESGSFKFAAVIFDGTGHIIKDFGAGKYIPEKGIVLLPVTNGILNVAIFLNTFYQMDRDVSFSKPDDNPPLLRNGLDTAIGQKVFRQWGPYWTFSLPAPTMPTQNLTNSYFILDLPPKLAD